MSQDAIVQEANPKDVYEQAKAKLLGSSNLVLIGLLFIPGVPARLWNDAVRCIIGGAAVFFAVSAVGSLRKSDARWVMMSVAVAWMIVAILFFLWVLNTAHKNPHSMHMR